jgi:GWxTD domain-containing protein
MKDGKTAEVLRKLTVAPRCRWRRSWWIPALLLVVMLSNGLPAARARTELAERHRKWLEEEVVYIISEDEKKLFLSLPTDEDRDRFIEKFWADRDPTPGTPENEYKEEHYRRIQYANTYFGSSWVADGWRSDRGRIYIILGPPRSRAPYPGGGGEIYPIELWFYSSSEPALPPFFYVMFYQPYGMDDYRLYSPYVDGPTKLVRTSGTENNRYGAYRRLRQLNLEVARASLTLIPSEPADIDSPPSMTSDGMLMKVMNLANDKFHKERLERQRQLRDEVQVKITFDIPALEVATLPLRDPEGNPFLHYSLQIPEAQNYTVARHKDKYYISLEAQVRVLDMQNKPIYEVTREASEYYDEKEMNTRKGRPLAFEDRVPLVPGKYKLEFMLLNHVDRVYYRSTATVEVEPPQVKGLVVGDPVLVQRCQPPERGDEPFTIGDMRCFLQARAEIPQGVKATLNLLYPVQMEPSALAASTQPLQVTYTVGRLDRAIEPHTVEDALDRTRFDRFGTLLVGKSIPLSDLPAGNYRLGIDVRDPVTGKHAATTFSFRLGAAPLPLPNVLTPESARKDLTDGNLDYWRGLCALGQGDTQAALAYLSRALKQNPQHQQVRLRLADVYFSQGAYGTAASLLQATPIEKNTDGETVRLLLASLEKNGQLQRAIDVGEQALGVVNPTPEIYQLMAGLYDQAGLADKAQQAREQARRLTARTNQ